MNSLIRGGALIVGAALGLGTAPGFATDALHLPNVMPPWEHLGAAKRLPVVVAPFTEQVGTPVVLPNVAGAVGLELDGAGQPSLVYQLPRMPEGTSANAQATGSDGRQWFATDHGLFFRPSPAQPLARHDDYGLGGPLATRVTALVIDSRGVLWVGTPLGLSLRHPDGSWSQLRGKEGLPVEHVTALAIDGHDNLWIGSTRGVILHRPYAQGRRWFYREGPRYLPGDRVRAIALAPAGMPAWFLTDKGVGRIDTVTTTLAEKAHTIEGLVNARHRRLGLVAECQLDDARHPRHSTIADNDNDGLWTAYHVAAMSLCYGATQDPAARASARQGMAALYLLQNASGTPGLVARSVVPAAIGKTKDAQWRPTPDGRLYWKSDTSSDEIDGHYLAFYTYYRHIAQADPTERARCVRQVRALTDYLLAHHYQLIDWTVRRTTWGFWDPETLNHNPDHYLESGLNSLQILSFLKVAHYITGDARYATHYQRLIRQHGYLGNVLLSKKVFPDEDNHSDNQLAFVAWYPILQLEHDPVIRAALLAGVRRHYETVKAEHSAFFTFVYATVDPDYADLDGAIENLRQIPTDRRQWRQVNSQRADVQFALRPNRFREPALLHVLPADEYAFNKWNADPFVPDGGGDGREEDDGAAYLLPYWMARCHGLITEAAPRPAIP